MRVAPLMADKRTDQISQGRSPPVGTFILSIGSLMQLREQLRRGLPPRPGECDRGLRYTEL